MNIFLLFAETKATDFILPGVLVVILIGLMVYSYIRRGKMQKEASNMITSLKKGDKIKTYAGVIGEIEEIIENETSKDVLIKTGINGKFSYYLMDINAIYALENPLLKEDKIKLENSSIEDESVKDESVAKDAENTEKIVKEEKSEVKKPAIKKPKNATKKTN